MRDGAQRTMPDRRCFPSLIMAAIAVLWGGAATCAEPASAESRDAAATSEAAKPKADDGSVRGAEAERGRLTLSGKCFDEMVRPFAGATVALYRLHPDYPALPERLHEMQSDAEGAYRFPDLEPPPDDSALDPWKYSIVAAAPGRGTRAIRVPASTRGKMPDLLLPLAQMVSGRVIDKQGRPVEGAEIWLSTIGNKPIEGLLSTKSDGEGRFTIADLPPLDPRKLGVAAPEETMALHYFHVRHPEFIHRLLEYSRADEKINVQLEPGESLEVTVVDQVTQASAAGVVVSLHGTHASRYARWYQVLTDEQGACRFTSVAPGKYNLWASAPDRTCVAFDSVSVPENPQIRGRIRLSLIEGAWIEGRVTTLDNRPITDGREPGNPVRVGLHGPSRPRSGPAGESCDVDDEGRFRLHVAPGRNYPFIANTDLWERTWRRDKYENGVDVQPGQTLTVNFRILDKKPPPPRPKRDPVVLPLPVEDERRAANEIRDLGGWYALDDEQHVVEVNMVYHEANGVRYDNGYTESDEALYAAHAFPRLKRLYLHKGQATDEALRGINRLADLEVFFVWDAIKLTDRGVKHLAGLEKLYNIHISGSRIGDDSLAVFATLPALSRMSMQMNNFSDAGLEHLSGMQQLRSLWIGMSNGTITDAGLKHLEGLENLQELDVQRSRVTDDGIAELKRALPALQVIK